MLKRVFHVLLLGAHGGATVGVRVVCHERPYVIHYRVRYLGSDYDGIRMGVDWEGANSLHACPKCSNVFKRGSDLAHRLGNAVETSCVDKSLLIHRSNDDFEDAVQNCLSNSSYRPGRSNLSRRQGRSNLYQLKVSLAARPLKIV